MGHNFSLIILLQRINAILIDNGHRRMNNVDRFLTDGSHFY